MIINEQKVHCWGGYGWTLRCFYLYEDGRVHELVRAKRNDFFKPPKLYGKVVAMLVCKSKCDHAETTRTGKLTFRK